jgi:uncharacterized membrane protein YedE/YeeE
MQADWLWGFFGGTLIGIAAAVYLIANGRIMGASGMVAAVATGADFRQGRYPAFENLAFLAGLVGVPGLVWLATGQPQTHLTANPILLIAAGLAVGAGTRMANGCTSGHGVCGMSRLSLRGIVATVFYLLAGGLTIVVFRHVLGVL